MALRVNIIVLLLILFCTNLVNSQTYEEYVKSEKEKIGKFEKERQKEIAKLADKYDEYVKQADKEFADYLQQEWKKYNAFKGVEVPKRPKPVKIPKIDSNLLIDISDGREIPAKLPDTTPVSVVDKLVNPIIQKREKSNFLKTAVEVNYYGSHFSFDIDSDLAGLSLQDHSINAVIAWWKTGSNANYNGLVNQLLDVKNKHSLNDWAYFMLISKTATAINQNDDNDAHLLTWFLMIRSGYKVKIAFDSHSIYVLVPAQNEIYGKSYLMINSQRFYFVDNVTSNSFQTYNFDYPGSDKVIDFNIYSPLNIGADYTEKKIDFSFNEKKYEFHITLNMNTLYFMND